LFARESRHAGTRLRTARKSGSDALAPATTYGVSVKPCGLMHLSHNRATYTLPMRRPTCPRRLCAATPGRSLTHGYVCAGQWFCSHKGPGVFMTIGYRKRSICFTPAARNATRKKDSLRMSRHIMKQYPSLSSSSYRKRSI
jgi:hypothetical protein